MKAQISIDMLVSILIALIVITFMIGNFFHLYPYNEKMAGIIKIHDLQDRFDYSYFLFDNKYNCIADLVCNAIYFPYSLELIMHDGSDIATIYSYEMRNLFNGPIFSNKTSYLNIINNHEYCSETVAGPSPWSTITVTYTYHDGICVGVYQNGTVKITYELNCVCKNPSTRGTGGSSFILFKQPVQHIETITPEPISKFGKHSTKKLYIFGKFKVDQGCKYKIFWNITRTCFTAPNNPICRELNTESKIFSYTLGKYILEKCASDSSEYTIFVIPLEQNLSDMFHYNGGVIIINETWIPPFIVQLGGQYIVFPTIMRCTYNPGTNTSECNPIYYEVGNGDYTLNINVFTVDYNSRTARIIGTALFNDTDIRIIYKNRAILPPCGSPSDTIVEFDITFNIDTGNVISSNINCH